MPGSSGQVLKTTHRGLRKQLNATSPFRFRWSLCAFSRLAVLLP